MLSATLFKQIAYVDSDKFLSYFYYLPFIKNIPSLETDETLMHSYKCSGDIAVLGELYQRYMDLIYGVCLKYFKEPEDAKDAVLNIFEELIKQLQKHDVIHFKSWLYQVAKNHCLMQLRSSKKGQVVSLDVSFMQLEENGHLNGILEKEESLTKMEYCMGKLPDEQRKAIQLFYLEGKCYNEISESTGMDWSKVKSFIQNGRRNLKICMDKQALTSGIQK